MNKHKGFTLVELLIVIVVIGILASMMMISTSESTSTAKANTIISNLRNFSMAAMAYYTDYIDDLAKDPTKPGNNVEMLWNDGKTNESKNILIAKNYMHNEGDIPDLEKYHIRNDSGTWWAGYDASNADARIKEKLAGRATSANLKGSASVATPPKKSEGKYPDYNKDAVVWLLIRTNKRN